VSVNRLLLVDDNPTNLELLKELIDQNLPDCSALLARSGEEALELVRDTALDGAFIDVQMPGMDGLELCRRLKADPRLADLPVVLITAHQSTPELRAMGLDAGAYDFISQPIRNVELLARIRAMLRIRANEERLRESNQGLHQEVVRKTAALRWLTGLITEGEPESQSLPQDTLEVLSGLFDSQVELDFELFRSQLFGLFPVPLQETLVTLALLEEIPLRLAERLSVIDNVKGALDFLERHNFYVRYRPQRDSYQFLDPFREFLRGRAHHDLTERQMVNALGRAADWWLEQGQPAKAIGCLLRAEKPREAETIIKQVAPLLLANGELDSLPFASLPPDLDPEACPWLSCCQGVVLLEKRPQAGMSILSQALAVLHREGDLVGELFARTQLLRGAMFAEGNLVTLRCNLEAVEALLERLGSACDEPLRIQASLQAAFAGLITFCDQERVQRFVDPLLASLQQAQHPEFQAWLRLIYGYQAFFSGNWRRCFRELEASGRFLKGEGLSLLTRLAFMVLKVLVLDLLGDRFGCNHQMNLIRELAGNEFLEQSSLQQLLALIEVQQAMSAGHWRQAWELIEHGPEHENLPGPHLESLRLQLRGLLLARDGEAAGAGRDLRRSRELRDQVGGAYFVVRNRLLCSLGWIALGEKGEAGDCLRDVRERSGECGDRQWKVLVDWLLAWLGGEGEGENFQAAGLRLAEELQPQEPCLLPVWYLPGILPPLRAALTQSAESRQLLKVLPVRQGVALREDGEVIPLLQLQCLGGLSIRWRDQLVLQARDLPAAIRQLLSLLISAPGLQISQDEVQALLWPDSPAERSRSKFDSLLLRSRKLLDEALPGCNSRHYLTLQRGMLSLEHCRIDAVEFENFGRTGIRHIKRKEFWQAEGCFRRAFRLWRGELNLGVGLDERSDLYRQNLLLLFLECVQRWSEMLHLTGQDEEAVQIVQKALSVDPIQDGLVGFLYQVYAKQGKSIQAGQVLRDYAEALKREGYSAEEIRETLVGIEAWRG